MIGYQVGASIRELFALRFRALLLILQVIVVAATLAATLNDTLRSIDDISVAHSLEGRDVLYFTMHYDEARAPDINETMAGVLRKTLDGEDEDYTIVKNNYFEGGHIQAPVLLALGGFAQAYGLPASSDTETVVIGARVGAYEVGDSLTFGDRQVSVAGRLPPGTAYLDPWMGYESLDEHVVLLSTYERFAATTAPGVWQEEAVGRTVLFDPTDKVVEEYVSAAGSTGGIGVIPQRLDERVATVYEAQLARSGMFLVFFGCLLLVLVGTATSAIDALVASNLRRYAIEQLYGAHTGHVVARVNLFLAAAFSLPTLLIFAVFAAISRNVAEVVPFVAGAVVVNHVALSVRAVITLSRVSVTSLLRKE